LARALIDGENLTIEQTVEVARDLAEVGIADSARSRVEQSRSIVEQALQEGRRVYGVTTGFGALSETTISAKDTALLQRNLVRSHAAGVGRPAETEIVRATMLLRANTLAKGYSGVRLEILETLVELINKHVHPLVPQQGSVGASGDLIPLAHIALAMIGEGTVEYERERLPAREALSLAKVSPVELAAKEGLALVNGSQFTTAMAAICLYDSERLLRNAEIAAAMTFEALLGNLESLDERLYRLRAFKGPMTTADNLRKMIADSELISARESEKAGSIHDPYSVRCMPQVAGTARDILSCVRRVLEIEINSATDNPLVFPDEPVIVSGGNFHGQPIAAATDMLAIALTMLGNIAERRIARLTDPKLSNGLPAFLVPRQSTEGLSSGFMMAQVAAASLASENKILSHPASVDSLPTSASFEDFVSMGTASARKAMRILGNVEHIVALELLCAAQALDLRMPAKLGRGTEAAYRRIRERVVMLTDDRALSDDIEAAVQMIRQGSVSTAVESATEI